MGDQHAASCRARACLAKSRSAICRPVCRVEIAGRLVGDEDRRVAAPAPGRSPRAAARRPKAGPDSASCGRRARRRPVRRGAARRRRRAPASSSGTATFSSAVMFGIRWKDWKTMPMLRPRKAASCVLAHVVADGAPATDRPGRCRAVRGRPAPSAASTCRSRTARRCRPTSPASIVRSTCLSARGRRTHRGRASGRTSRQIDDRFSSRQCGPICGTATRRPVVGAGLRHMGFDAMRFKSAFVASPFLARHRCFSPRRHRPRHAAIQDRRFRRQPDGGLPAAARASPSPQQLQEALQADGLRCRDRQCRRFRRHDRGRPGPARLVGAGRNGCRDPRARRKRRLARHHAGEDPREPRSSIIERLKTRGIEGDARRHARTAQHGRATTVEEFDAIFPDLAKKYELVFYPFFLDGVATHAELQLSDGMHPNAKGVAVMVERFLPYAERLVDGIESAGGNE